MNNFLNWLQSTPYLYNYNNFKNILIYSNIIFILICLLVIKYKKNYNKNYTKYSLSLLLVFIMGIISAKYHHCQCYNTFNGFKKWFKIDVLFAFIISLICITCYYKNINKKIIYLIILLIILFSYSPDKNKLNIYIITHSLWHILVSIIFFLLIIND